MGLVSSSSYFTTYYSGGPGGDGGGGAASSSASSASRMTPEQLIQQKQMSESANNEKENEAEPTAADQKKQQTDQKPKKEKASSTPTKTKPAANVLPLLADGRFEVGCADIMLAELATGLPEECAGILARIFYPTAIAPGHDPGKASTADHGEAVRSDAQTSLASRRYLQWKPPTDYVQGLAKYRGMSVGKLNFFLDWIVGSKQIPVYWQPPMAPGDEKFPVVVFSHGISGSRFIYTTLCASLASHGFVVAALEHRDGSCCWTYLLEKEKNDSDQTEAAAAAGVADTAREEVLVKKPIEMVELPLGEEEYEMRLNQVKKRMIETIRMRKVFTKLDADLLLLNKDKSGGGKSGNEHILLGNDFDWSQLKNRLDLGRAVSMGHSFGGASALAACAEYQAGFASCVIFDGWLYPLEQRLYAEVVQPVLMLSASKWQWARNVKRLQRLQQAQGGDPTASGKLMFTLKDIVHQSYSDFGFLAPGMVGRYFGVQGDLDPLLTGTAIVELTLTFLHADDPRASGDALRALVARKYAHFVQEGSDIPREQLDALDADEVAEAADGDARAVSDATREEEERKVEADAGVEKRKEEKEEDKTAQDATE